MIVPYSLGTGISLLSLGFIDTGARCTDSSTDKTSKHRDARRAFSGCAIPADSPYSNGSMNFSEKRESSGSQLTDPSKCLASMGTSSMVRSDREYWIIQAPLYVKYSGL
jgi:hypothetical protein